MTSQALPNAAPSLADVQRKLGCCLLRTQHPEQQPSRYGCSSWRHIIHASQQFEICKRVNTEQVGREVWYRSRQEQENMQGKNKA